MIWGIENSERIRANPNANATCPLCGEKLINKCGIIKVWHFAHKSKEDCDDWYEPESEWHLNWKNQFSKECQEVVMGLHRADIKLTNGLVIEFQSSPLSPEQIKEREDFYGNMIWVLNGRTLGKGFDFRPKKDIITFRWKNPHKAWWSNTKPIYVDLGDKYQNQLDELEEYWKEFNNEYLNKEGFKGLYNSQKIYYDLKKDRLIKYIDYWDNKLLEIKKIYPKIPCGGWGKLITKEEFLNKYGILKWF